MKNTSMGYHTFSFFQRIKEDEYQELSCDFQSYANGNNNLKGFPIEGKEHKRIGWEYSYKRNKGIRWQLLSARGKHDFVIRGVRVIINPKALIESNYITAAQENDLEMVEKIYNNEAAKISPILLAFGSCSINRADYCLNIDLKELGIPCTPEQMIYLIKQGNVPKSCIERKAKSRKQHRSIPDPYSFYLESESYVINFYWKYAQQKEKHPNFAFRDLSRNVIRFEVQSRYPRLYSYSKGIKYESKYYTATDELSMNELYERIINDIKNPSIPIDVMLMGKVSDKVVRKELFRVIGKGDYFTLDDARSIVETYNFRRDKEERLIYALEMVNESRGIEKAKAKMYGPDLDDFKRSLKDLDNMLINPVTIPRRWDIRYIPNPLRSYYDALYEEELVPVSEYQARKHIDEFLMERI